YTENDPTVNTLAKTNLTCSSNQMVKWNGSAWFCTNDLDTNTQLNEITVESYISNDLNTGFVAYDDGTKLSSSSIYIGSSKVGIHTSNPSTELEVVGVIKANSFEGDGSSLTGIDTGFIKQGSIGTIADKIYISHDSSNNLYGTSVNTHINLGINSITGTDGQNYSYATVSGGSGNSASGDRSTIAGGEFIIASGNHSSIGGGESNSSQGQHSRVGGGLSNQASGAFSTVSGGRSNVASNAAAATVAGGWDNVASGGFSTIAGGYLQQASGSYSTVSGGFLNKAAGQNSAVLGGRALQIAGQGSFGFRGGDNAVQIIRSAADTAYFMEVSLCVSEGILDNSAGCGNSQTLNKGHIYASAFHGDGSNLTGISSGFSKLGTTGTLADKIYISRDLANILYGNTANTHVNLGIKSITGETGLNQAYATVGGGYNNEARGYSSTISGGYNNQAAKNYGSIGGGLSNIILSGDYTTISGGQVNKIWSGDYSTIGGGMGHEITGIYSTIAGGYVNGADGNSSTIGGGYNNISGGNYSTIAGGYQNLSTGHYSTIIGGKQNTVSGQYSAVIGGHHFEISGQSSLGFRGGNSLGLITRSAPDTVYFMESSLCVSEGILDDSAGCGNSQTLSKGHIYASAFHGDGSNLSNINSGFTMVGTTGALADKIYISHDSANIL
ncbi:hypothetical protein MJH12_14270, partial [bacterium]|nr:hypothetical protein [bacterium]